MEEPFWDINRGILTEAIVREEEKHKRLSSRNANMNENNPNVTLKTSFLQLRCLLDRIKSYTNFLLHRIAETSRRLTHKVMPLLDSDSNIPEASRVQGSPPKRLKLDSDKEVKHRFVQPKFFVGSNLHHHREGYEWMKILFENGISGGILGRDTGDNIMQSVALFAFMIEMGLRGPFLICAPLPALPKWLIQFRNLAPMIPVVLYHGPKSERLQLRTECNTLFSMTGDETDCHAYPIVLTSYEIAFRDTFIFEKREWKYVIADENHRSDEFDSFFLRRAPLLRATCQILLTNTPLRHVLFEQLLLLHYVLPQVFEDNDVPQYFDSFCNTNNREKSKFVCFERELEVLERLHSILCTFTLQRIKPDVNLDIPVARGINMASVPLEP